MKKLIIILFITVLAFAFSACGDPKDPEDTAPETDMDQYPAEIIDWTSENFMEYFKAQGILPIDEGYGPGVGSHADYWGGTPVKESISWSFTDDGLDNLYVLILDPDLGDVSDEESSYWVNFIKTERGLPYEAAILGKVDHMVGNVIFLYSSLCEDPDIIAKEEAAYDKFLKDTGYTAEF